MRMLLALAFLLLLPAAGSLGCLGVVTPAAGVLYTDVKGPLHPGERVGSKEGRACARSILGLIATGDASIKSAAEAGGISRIDSVDTHSEWMLVMGSFCTIVRGS